MIPVPGIVGLAFVGAVVYQIFFTSEARLKRRLKKLEPTRVADAVDGQSVKIVGELVYTGPGVVSPLSGRTCAYYSIVVDERVSSKRAPQVLLRERKGVDFFVRDDSGVAMVRVGGGDNVLPVLVEDHWARVTVSSPDERLREFLRQRDGLFEKRFFEPNVRAHEGILEAGERVLVYGVARWMPDADAPGGGYREPGKRLVLQASEAVPMILSDDRKVQ